MPEKKRNDVCEREHRNQAFISGFPMFIKNPYKNRIFIAEHGSWNRKDQIGYRITMIQLSQNNTGNIAETYSVFTQGWLQNGKSWGRPVDLLLLKDGSMLVSDDKAGAVYRIYYEE